MATRYIKLTNKKGEPSKKTAGHQAVLEAKGYECAVEGDHLAVQASEVIEGTVDISTPELAQEVLANTVAKKAVFSYQTAFKMPNGKELSGVMVLNKLGKASALVTKAAVKTAETKHNALDDIFVNL